MGVARGTEPDQTIKLFPATGEASEGGSRGNKIRAPNFRGRGSRIRRPIELVDDHSKWNILSFECESGVSILRATNGLVEALNAIYYP